MRIAPFGSSEFNIVSKGIYLRAQIGVLFQIPGRIKERMRIATFAVPEVEVMQEGIDFGAGDIAVLRQIPLRIEQRMRAALVMATPPQVVLQWVESLYFRILGQIPAGIEQRVRIPSFAGAVLEIMNQRIQASARHIRILAEIPGGVEKGEMLPAADVFRYGSDNFRRGKSRLFLVRAKAEQ